MKLKEEMVPLLFFQRQFVCCHGLGPLVPLEGSVTAIKYSYTF